MIIAYYASYRPIKQTSVGACLQDGRIHDRYVTIPTGKGNPGGGQESRSLELIEEGRMYEELLKAVSRPLITFKDLVDRYNNSYREVKARSMK